MTTNLLSWWKTCKETLRDRLEQVAPKRKRPTCRLGFEVLEGRCLMSVVNFASATYSVGEAGGTVELTMTLDTALSAAGSITYYTSSGTATAGSDFTNVPYEYVSWATTDPLSKTINISITNDGANEGNETFTVHLTAPYNMSLGTVSTATVTIIDNDVPPDADDDEYTLLHDTSLSVSAAAGVLANDVTFSGNPLEAVLVTGPSDGDLTLNDDGSFIYLPDPGVAGADSFTYHATDGTLNSSTVTVTLTVANAAPTAAADSFSVAHDRWLHIPSADLLANDADADEDDLAVVIDVQPTHGTLEDAGNGFYYVPDEGYTGADTFEYYVTDGIAASAAVEVDITVTNAAPVGANDIYRVHQNLALSVWPEDGVLVNDSDADGDSVTVTLLMAADYGDVTLNPDGSFTFTPDTSYSGTDSFTYEIDDGFTTDTATVTLIIHAGNSAPVSSSDSYTISHDRTLKVSKADGVLGNDSDSYDDIMKATLSSGPAHGIVSFFSDGSFEYTPDEGYVGTDTFYYVVSDGLATSSTTTVTITVTNSAPTGAADSYQIPFNQTFELGGRGVLDNDEDEDHDALTVGLVANSGPDHGDLTLNPDGSFAFAPDTNYVGSDSFEYTIDDGLDESDPVTVTFTIGNAAPVAYSDFYTLTKNVALETDAPGVLLNDYDPEELTITAVLEDEPEHGDIDLNSDGSFTFTPDNNYVGDDSFTYRVSDGNSSSAPQVVALTIKNSNSAPVADDDTYTMPHDTDIERTTILDNDTDADFDQLWVALVSGPAHGTLILKPDGFFRYVPDADYDGTDSFDYQLYDGTPTSNTATVTITITNEAPVAEDDWYSIDAVAETEIGETTGVLYNDSDQDDIPTVVLVSGPTYGTLDLNDNGSFSYTPGGSYAGSDSFTYELQDVSNTSNTATVHLVSGPIARDDFYQLVHDQTLTFSADDGVMWNDFDFAGNPLEATLLTQPAHGDVTFNGDGSFAYTPDAGYLGSDSFTYEISDGTLTSNTATVSIETINTAPETGADTYRVVKNQVLTVDARRGVLGSDWDPDRGEVLTAELVTGPQFGTLSFFVTGAFVYTPNSGYVGTDMFVYEASDGEATSAPVTVEISVADTAGYALPSGSMPRAVAAADLNGDTYPDVVVADIGESVLRVLLGNGDGTFDAGSDVSVAADPIALAIADFNNDTYLDVAVVHESQDLVAILFGDGTGALTADNTIAVGDAPSALALGDFDNDGEIDLAVTNAGADTVSVLKGAGDGTFSNSPWSPVTAGDKPVSLAVGDFNEDGDVDILIANQDSDDIVLAIGDGAGAFTTEAIAEFLDAPIDIVADDFNDDGNLDFAVANQESANISVFSGAGDGTFTQPDEFSVAAQPRALATGDYNDDGLPDIAVTDYAANEVIILASHAIGTFYVQEQIPVFAGPVDVVLADLNLDGRADVIVPALMDALLAQLMGPPAPITISGTIEYDRSTLAAAKPIRHAKVEVRLQLPSSSIGQTVYTTDRGRYVASFPAQTYLPWFLLTVSAETRTPGNGPNQVPRATRALYSGVAQLQFTRTHRNTPNITASLSNVDIKLGDTTYLQKTFWSFDAGVTAARLHTEYLKDLTSNAPTEGNGSIDIQTFSAFAGIGEASVTLGSFIRLFANDWKDWDTINHEYGHAFAQEIGFFPTGSVWDYGPGTNRFPYAHYEGQNTRVTNRNLTRLNNNRLAFAEGFADFYSMVAQERDLTMPRGAVSIESAPGTGWFGGDHKYGPNERNEGDPIQVATGRSAGEDEELTVMRILWDFYDLPSPADTTNDLSLDHFSVHPTDSRLSFVEIIDLIRSYAPRQPGVHIPNQPVALTLSDFYGNVRGWKIFELETLSRFPVTLNRELYQINAVFELNNVSPRPGLVYVGLNPTNRVSASGDRPTFSFRIPSGMNAAPLVAQLLNRWKIWITRMLPNGEVIDFQGPEIPIAGSNNINFWPSVDEWNLIRATPGRKRWSVQGWMSEGGYETGGYLSDLYEFEIAP